MKPQKPTKKSRSLSQVRIIGGEYRRRLVTFVDADGLRPTPDRLRETLFNWLQNAIPNATVLDCCAGSGVLSFEALSRGAKSVTLIEPNLTQFHKLNDNVQILHIPSHKITLCNSTAQGILSTFSEPFDIIFIDPPYRLDLWVQILTLLATHHLYHPNSLIYIEADRPLETFCADCDWLIPLKSSKVGTIFAGIFGIKKE